MNVTALRIVNELVHVLLLLMLSKEIKQHVIIEHAVVVKLHSMHRLQRCGLLLPKFHGLCVCLSVGHNHEPC